MAAYAVAVQMGHSCRLHCNNAGRQVITTQWGDHQLLVTCTDSTANALHGPFMSQSAVAQSAAGAGRRLQARHVAVRQCWRAALQSASTAQTASRTACTCHLLPSSSHMPAEQHSSTIVLLSAAAICTSIQAENADCFCRPYSHQTRLA